MLSEPIRVSYSLKYLYDWCPRQFKYARVEKVKPDTSKPGVTVVGIAIHKVLELMYKSEQFSLGFMLEQWPLVFDKTAAREGLSEKLRQKWIDKGEGILVRIFSMARDRGLLVKPIASEWVFKFPVTLKSGQEIFITGKVDLIIRVGDDVWVLDLKTGGYKIPKKELDETDQLTIYWMAVRKILKIEDSKLGLWYPVRNAILWTTRNEQHQDKLIDSIEKTLNEIEEKKFEPTYQRCYLCQFTNRCQAEDMQAKTGVNLEWFTGGMQWTKA